MSSKELQQLQNVKIICNRSQVTRSLFKRIDENRQILESLQEEAPELLERCPWFEGWIASNDIFFNDLANALGLDPFTWMQREDCPRPWTGKDGSLQSFYMTFEANLGV